MATNTKAVVIGSGLGGLAAGIELAKAGHAVTLFEKEPQLGGYAVGFERQGFSFDVALHVVPAGADGEPFFKSLEQLGIADKVRFRRLAQGFDVHFGDTSYLLPNQADDLYSYLGEKFPEERKGLSRLRTHIETVAPVYSDLLIGDASRWKTLPPFLVRLGSFLRHGVQPTGDYLREYVSDPRLLALLFQPAIFPCVPMAETPTINFLMMFYFLVNYGAYTIEGGGPALVSALVDRFRELGGEIADETKITAIKVENGVAVGVSTDEGDYIETSAVIANTAVPVLVDRLIGRQHFPPAYLRSLDRLKPSLSVVQLQVGLDCSVRELGLKSLLTVCLPDADIDSQIAAQEKTLDVVGFSLTAPGIDDPTQLGRRHQVVSAISAAPPDLWRALSPQAYLDTKARIQTDLLARIERLVPGFKRHTVAVDLATPTTFERYTDNPGGAIMGFRCNVGSHRQLMAAAKVPIDQLAVAGAWTHQLGGFMSSVRAGMAAAQRVGQ